jgi:hypothetical protein
MQRLETVAHYLPHLCLLLNGNGRNQEAWRMNLRLRKAYIGQIRLGDALLRPRVASDLG